MYFQLQQTNSPRENDVIKISEKYVIQEKFLFMCEQWQKKVIYKNKTKQ